MSGPQLERSVLQRKERDELHAIAQAMALKTGSRTKKADIIDQILRATGVEVHDSTSSPSSPSDSAEATKANGPGQGAANGSARSDGARQARKAPPKELPDGDSSGGSGGSANGVEIGASNGALAGGEATGAEAGATAAKASGEQTSAQRPRGPNQPSANGQGRQGQGNQGQGHSGGGSDGGGDGGNRRPRRRRGRGPDRGPERDRGERDLQSGGSETSYSGEPTPVAGLLDLSEKGYGFLRTSGFLPNPRDVYVSVSQVRRFALRKGDPVEGTSRPASQNESYPALVHVSSVAGMSPDEARQRPRFEDLTPLFPDSRLKLEVPGDSANMTARIVDLLSPIGKGQRGLIVSPPKAGKTTVLKQIAHSIEANNPEIHLMVLLVDERPEEVTDMRRSVKGEVIASTFDRPADEHTAVAELTIERARRLVESGRDVVIVLDGITRLARAYNLAAPTTGRIMSGGVDSGALYPPKKFFGAARNIEEGGSLTILATALVETGSRMDEVIFEEFKGTGNMELRLDRRLAERRIYPAIEVNASSTRHEELLFDRSQLAQVWKLRRVLNALASDGTAAAGLELLMDKIKTTKSNDEFLAEIAKGPTPGM